MGFWLTDWEIRTMIGLDARGVRGSKMCFATMPLRHPQRLDLFQRRMSSRSSNILSIFILVTFCFSTALCELTGWVTASHLSFRVV